MSKYQYICKIGLLYHGYHSPNLGLDALSTAHVMLLEDICNHMKIKPIFLNFYSMENEKVEGEYKSEFLNIPNRKNLNMIMQFRKCDLVLDISSGDSFTDIYGLRRSLSMIVSKILLVISGVPFILSPQTIGPFNHKSIKFLAKFILSKSKQIFIRDQLSINEIPIKLREKTIITTDIAFTLPFEQRKYSDGSRLSIALNVSGLLYNGGYSKRSMFDLGYNYKLLIDQLIATLLREQVDLCLVPHVIVSDNPIEDDFRVCETLARTDPRIRMAPTFRNAIEAKSFISEFDVFIGSRMHASIASFSAGIPTFPISYSRKFKGLYSNLGYEYVLDASSKSEEQVIHTLIEWINHRAEIKTQVLKSNELAKSMIQIYKKSLSSIIVEIMRDKITGRGV